MTDLKELHLILYFTQDVSLDDWGSIGMLEREVGIYHALRPDLRKITFVTYGKKGEQVYIPKLEKLGIDVVFNRWQLSAWLYRFWITRLLPFFWRKPWVVKSNQMRGADAAMEAARNGGGKFVARCGYLFANFIEREYGVDALEAEAARALEAGVFHGADRGIVTTERMKSEIIRKYGIAEEKINVIPNYVLTDLFIPTQIPPKNDRLKIGFVGRLEEQKNLFSLLDAIEGLEGVEVQMVGSGSQREDLQREIDERNLPITLLGNLPHDDLPEFLQSCDVFILPSLFEGHPKSLIEAMACGLPVIGTDVQGTKDVIVDGKNGVLCGTSADSIRNAIIILLNDEPLREGIGKAARQFVENTYALSRVVGLEKALLEDLVNE